MRDTPPAERRSRAARRPAAPAANKHQQRTAATRHALLQSARRIFARDGFQACRIEDIAAATGHTRGAFYAHFPAKEDLFFAIFEQEAGRRIEEIRQVLDGCATRPERLAALRAFYVDRVNDRQWAMLVLEFKLFALRHPRLRPKLAATHRRLRALLRLEIVAESCDEPTKAALEAVLSGLSLEHAYDPLRISKEQTTATLGLLFDALVPGDTLPE
ncbi:MAG TPA: helix-turn-helix domain-containing protein [Bryobacteraceae bacterium]|nr:helix-turn-helix domain-containing protein [Bryobacteraceae bacterium]